MNQQQNGFQYESIVNFIVIVVSWIMIALLSIAFIIEYIKGARTALFVTGILSVGILSTAVGNAIYQRCPPHRSIRFITFAGFYVMYFVTLLTATTPITFTFVFPLAALYCIYLDRWFTIAVSGFIVLLNGYYIVSRFQSVSRQDVGEAAYNQFTTMMLIHSFVILLYMACLVAVVYVFTRMRKEMNLKIQEASDARLAEQLLFQQATTDGLTGLLNRSYFVEQVERRLKQGYSSSALVLMDIDNFKQINDTRGHIAGDMVLTEFAKVLQKHGAGSMVGRVGGEEFALFMSDRSPGECMQTVEQIRAHVESCVIRLEDDSQITVQVSGGISYDDKGGRSFEQLYQQADIALYESKNAGKNRITFTEMQG
jgi:diguanylate cyclase (GGDEF)-like protein